MSILNKPMDELIAYVFHGVDMTQRPQETKEQARARQQAEYQALPGRDKQTIHQRLKKALNE